MDQDLAQMVANSAARAANELANLMPLLKDHATSSATDEKIRVAIAGAVYEIGLVADEIFKLHPKLKIEAEARLEKFGRSYF